jgi:hypothetical protein
LGNLSHESRAVTRRLRIRNTGCTKASSATILQSNWPIWFPKSHPKSIPKIRERTHGPLDGASQPPHHDRPTYAAEGRGGDLGEERSGLDWTTLGGRRWEQGGTIGRRGGDARTRTHRGEGVVVARPSVRRRRPEFSSAPPPPVRAAASRTIRETRVAGENDGLCRVWCGDIWGWAGIKPQYPLEVNGPVGACPRRIGFPAA